MVKKKNLDKKQELRKKITELRRNINSVERSDKSFKINENLSLYLKKNNVLSESIHVFLPIQNEPDLTKLYQDWLNDGLRLYAPSVAGERDLQHYQLTSLDSVRRGPLHTMEPVPNGEAVSPQFDIILVPGIAFDRDGNRMGFGKGFYDRFLMEGSGIKIGICYEFQLVDQIPISENDVPVDIVITEESTINIKKRG